MFTLKGRDFDFRTQGSLRDRNRDHAVQVISFPLKEGMLLHVQHDVQIAGWPSVKTAFTESCEADASAVFDAGGNLRVNRALTENSSFAFALGARVGHDAAGSLTGRASARNTEKSLLIANLSPACARTAGDGSLARGRARSAAIQG
jgi:hypothetical protein